MKNTSLKPNLIFLMMAFMSLTISALSQGNYGFPVQSKTDKGTIEGLYDTRSGLSQYFGIPFAKPPVGDLRWRAPQAVHSWSGVKCSKDVGQRPVQAVKF